MNRIDIVIVNFKSTDHLMKCLDSIYKDLKEEKARIFVEDNASDGKIDQVKALFPDVVISKNRENLGFAKAVNKGSKKGHAPYLVILNPDTVVFDGFFAQVLSHMEKSPEVGILGPRILNADGTTQGSARAFPTPLTAFFGRRSLLTKWFPRNRISRQNLLTTFSDGTTPMEVDWVSGACMVVRRKAVEKVGLLDESFFMYWEDADWCRRMNQKGWRVVYYPSAQVFHYVGVSSDRLFSRSVLEFHKSSYRLFQKYAGKRAQFLGPFVLAGLLVRFFSVLVSPKISALSKAALGWYKHRPAIELSRPEDGRVRVLRMIARLNIGGPAIHVYLLTRYFNNGRIESSLITGSISKLEGDMSYLFDGSLEKPVIIPELQREISPTKDVKAFLKILKILWGKKPDIVHSHTAKAGFIARLAGLIYNLVSSRHVYVIHTFHGHVFEGYFGKFRSQFYIILERLLASITDAIVAISAGQKQELAEKFRIAPARKIRTIGLGFELEPFLSSRKIKGQFRRQFGIDEKTVLIGIIGRLVPIKNQFMFLKAAKIFLDENPTVQVKFVVVGNGELRTELEYYCRRKGLSDHILFCGWIKEVPKVYADLDMVALTSINEGTPVSIIEAMAASVPVIATAVGGVLDLLGPRSSAQIADSFVVCKRGILCKKNNFSGLADGMQYLLKDNSGERHKRIERAHNFVIEHFSKDRLLRDMEELYLGLVKQGKGGPARVKAGLALSPRLPSEEMIRR